MSRFEFIANKFYEITAWSLLASVVMTLISKSDMIPSSFMADSIVIIFGSSFLPYLSMGS